MRKLRKYWLVTAVLVLLGLTSPSSADVNDFTFDSFHGEYQLSLNSAKDNRPEMLVTETLVANFPEIDQNHGIMRSIPTSSYGKFPGLIDQISVTDELGRSREFEVTVENGFTNLAIKPIDESFVHGKQTYVIKYHQAWVINNYQDTSGFDEFYWDVNGTGWIQSFDQVSATVSLDKALADNLVMDKTSCYQGPQGSTESCDFSSDAANQITFTSRKLEATENLTIAIAFNPNVANTSGPKVSGTFAWYGFFVCLALAILILIWAIYFRIFGIRSSNKFAFIVPQYKPAAEPGLLTSALVSRKTSHLHQASVVELAVKKLIEIEVVPDSKNKDFILRRTKVTTTNADHNSLLESLAIGNPGEELLLAHNMRATERNELSKSLLSLKAQAAKLVNSSGYFKKRALGIPAIGFIISLLVYVVWMLFAASLDAETDAGYVSAPVLSFALFTFLYWLLLSKRALTDKGSELVAYVKGLEMYIELAEKDRLEFLQSPQGALLKPSEIQGKQVLKLYEEVLPWAILLGLQKQWSKVLTDLYQDQGSPVWFIGSSALSDSFSNLDQVLTQSLAASSSGGSGGGGSSGGGGGGGGGGGI
ncbi:MAG: DUF2207 domain-containing protein [Micrococcales bacterium]|nr:DUF2207 domain-containing protein [Micrococcales bacterium]